jgi:hypothetical protein
MKITFEQHIGSADLDNDRNLQDCEYPLLSKHMRDLIINIKGNNMFINSAEVKASGIYFELKTLNSFDCLTMYTIESVQAVKHSIGAILFITLFIKF